MNEGINIHFTTDEMYRLKQFISLIDKPIQDTPVTLEFFRSEYEKHIEKNRSEKYLSSIKLSFDHLERNFSPHRIVTAIGLRDAELFIDVLKERAPKGYMIYYRTIKAAFNKAISWGYIKDNPFVKVKPPKVQKNRPEYIDSDQLSVISNQIKTEAVKSAVIFSFYTGCRLGELVNLKWFNIDLKGKMIIIGDEEFSTKARRQRFVPMNEKVVELMSRKQPTPSPLPGGDLSGYVFCKSNGGQFTGDYFSRKFKAACREAGMSEKIHWHSLRHSFASNLVMKGVPLYSVKELLGHSSISTTEIYSHLSLDTLKEAIGKL